MVLTGAASLAASLCASQLPAAQAADAPVITDRVYLDVAVDNKILVRVPHLNASLRPHGSTCARATCSLALFPYDPADQYSTCGMPDIARHRRFTPLRRASPPMPVPASAQEALHDTLVH